MIYMDYIITILIFLPFRAKIGSINLARDDAVTYILSRKYFAMRCINQLVSTAWLFQAMSADIEARTSETVHERSEGAAPKFSLSLGTSKTSGLQPRKRPHAVLEEDPQQDGDSENHQGIEVFGKQTEAASKNVRVIKSVQDQDWKDTSRRKRQKSGLPSESHATNGTQQDNEIIQEGMSKGGLTIAVRNNGPVDSGVSLEADAPTAPQLRTAEELALAALMGKRNTETRTIVAVSEEEAFQDSYENAPSAPTADDFTATPVDGFGAALLRGYLKNGRTLEDYGYDENAETSEVKKRPPLLGLGAKESGEGFELGVWGRAAKNQKGEGYIPLAMKNKKTGEVLSEAELKAKLEEQKKENVGYVTAGREGREHLHDRSRGKDSQRHEARDSGSSRDKRNGDDYDRRRESRREYEDGDDRDRRREAGRRDREYDRASERRHTHDRHSRKDGHSGRDSTSDGHRREHRRSYRDDHYSRR